MTPFTDSSCITRIHPVTTPAGRLLVLEPIIRSEWHSKASPVEKRVADIASCSAQSLLKQDYKDDISLEDAKALALKIMSKTMDSTKLGSEKRELFNQVVIGGASILRST
jgi:hypothetical protein